MLILQPQTKIDTTHKFLDLQAQQKMKKSDSVKRKIRFLLK